MPTETDTADYREKAAKRLQIMMEYRDSVLALLESFLKDMPEDILREYRRGKLLVMPGGKRRRSRR